MNEKSETKLCKYCQTEIPAKAKICPNCKKKQGGATKWFVAVVIVIILLIATFGGNGENNDAVADSTEQNMSLSKVIGANQRGDGYMDRNRQTLLPGFHS